MHTFQFHSILRKMFTLKSQQRTLAAHRYFIDENLFTINKLRVIFI